MMDSICRILPRSFPRRPIAPWLSASLLSASLLAACSGYREAGEGIEPGTAVVVVESEVGTIDPRFASSSYEIKISRLVFSGLMTADTADLSVSPLLADSVEMIDETGLEWRAVLKPGLRFHDGAPLTSRDVVYTFESVLDPATGSRYRTTYSYIVSVEADGPGAVRFRLSEPNASFLPDLTMPILPAHVLEASGGRFDRGGVVGSGPFRLASMDQGRIVLDRWPAPPAGTGAMSHVVFLTVRDDNARVLRLLGGGADLAQNNVPVHLLRLFEGKQGLRVESAPGASFTYVGLNTEAKMLADVRVRRALLHAIDRESIVEYKLHGRARLSDGMLPPMHWAYRGDVPKYPYDPPLARKLLDEAGFPDPDGDGPRARFTMVFKVGSNRFRVALARVIASYWRDIGIDVDVRPLEFGTLISHLDSGSFEVTTLQIPMVIEPNLYKWFFHSSQIPQGQGRGGANRWRYRSAGADALIEGGVAVQDEQGRKDVYGKLQALLASDLPVLPLWHEDTVSVLSDRVQGYELLPAAPFGPLAAASVAAP